MGTRTQQPCHDDDDDDLPGGPGPAATTISGQSVSMSGSVGSPSNRSEQTMATPASDNTFLRLNNLDIHGDEAGSQPPTANVKKKRGQRAVGGDKSGRGLRQFSMKGQQYDEKNIRRRVYDALNVLMAMDIISKDKKEIQWKGLPRTSLNDIEELKAERLGLRNRIEKKAAYLQELEEQNAALMVSGYQYVGLQNLIQRNEQLFSSENAPSGGVSLPFILVQKSIDDAGEGSSMSGMYQPPQIPLPSMSNTPVRTPTSPPLPGIIKARVKHEH
ncbi:Transcription factor-like protein DPB, partial [Cucurbita argyrosperma subsp. argyrosperma]